MNTQEILSELPERTTNTVPTGPSENSRIICSDKFFEKASPEFGKLDTSDFCPDEDDELNDTAHLPTTPIAPPTTATTKTATANKQPNENKKSK